MNESRSALWLLPVFYGAFYLSVRVASEKVAPGRRSTALLAIYCAAAAVGGVLLCAEGAEFHLLGLGGTHSIQFFSPFCLHGGALARSVFHLINARRVSRNTPTGEFVRRRLAAFVSRHPLTETVLLSAAEAVCFSCFPVSVLQWGGVKGAGVIGVASLVDLVPLLPRSLRLTQDDILRQLLVASWTSIFWIRTHSFLLVFWVHLAEHVLPPHDITGIIRWPSAAQQPIIVLFLLLGFSFFVASIGMTITG